MSLELVASTSTMGAVLQQHVKNAWQPLAFFSKKLNLAQQKFSAYNHELLAIYEATRHFCHILEVCHFNIFTDHKPITYAFQQKWDICSQRQFNHLDFIAQFPTDMQHISGQDNVADALSCVKSVTAPPSYNALAAS
jgi:cleavage and polyadenylation specificity factor subunit 1